MTTDQREIRRGNWVLGFSVVACALAVVVLAWMFMAITEDRPAHGQESVTAHDSCDPPEGFVRVPDIRAATVGGGAYIHTSADGWCRSRYGWKITHVRALLTTQSGRPGSIPWATYSSRAETLGRLCNNARTLCHAVGSDAEPCPLSSSTPGRYYREHLRVHTYGYSVTNSNVTFHHIRDMNSPATTRQFACGSHQPS